MRARIHSRAVEAHAFAAGDAAWPAVSLDYRRGKRPQRGRHLVDLDPDTFPLD